LFKKNQPKAISEFDAYLEDVSKSINISNDEVQNNSKRNRKLFGYHCLSLLGNNEVDEVWSTPKIFHEFK
jgi:hypothetical protein